MTQDSVMFRKLKDSSEYIFTVRYRETSGKVKAFASVNVQYMLVYTCFCLFWFIHKYEYE